MDSKTINKALVALGPNGNRKYINGLSDCAVEVLSDYEITTPLRLSHFWAQISHECNGLKEFEENLNYSVDGLLKTFGRHRISEADARKYGRATGRPANKEAIANIIYGGEWGRKNLGNTQVGDGFRFRGRGPKQITGRFNYTDLGKKLKMDLVSAPDLLLTPEIGLRAACEFWKSKNLNRLADKNDIVAITKAINGGTLGLANRRANFVIAWRIFANGQPLPQTGRSVASSSEAATQTAVAGGSGIGIYGAYEAGKVAISSASDIKDSAENAGTLIGMNGSSAIVIGAALIIIIGIGFLLYRNWKRAKEEDNE